jgi:hypothetical protein
VAAVVAGGAAATGGATAVELPAQPASPNAGMAAKAATKSKPFRIGLSHEDDALLRGLANEAMSEREWSLRAALAGGRLLPRWQEPSAARCGAIRVCSVLSAADRVVR